MSIQRSTLAAAVLSVAVATAVDAQAALGAPACYRFDRYYFAERWLGFSAWHPIGRDSVEVHWRNGLSGPVFRLAVRGDSLVGRVRFTTDVVGAEPPAEPASAVRVPCS